MFFSYIIEKYIPPKKGKKHILLVIRELLDFAPENRGTDINMALEFLTSAIKKRCTTFVISDFIDAKDYYKSLSIANNKHDVMALQVYDKREAELPNVGLMRMLDSETGEERWIDTSSKKTRQTYQKWWFERQQRMNITAQRCKVDVATMSTDEDYVKSLMALFKKRGVR